MSQNAVERQTEGSQEASLLSSSITPNTLSLKGELEVLPHGLSEIRAWITNKTTGQQNSEPRIKCLLRIISLIERFETIQ